MNKFNKNKNYINKKVTYIVMIIKNQLKACF